MGYISEDYYINVYHGEETTDDLSVLIERATDVIDAITGYGIGDVDRLPSVIAERVKKAVAAQVEYMDFNGGIAMLNSSPLAQASLGKFSYTQTYSQSADIRKGFDIAPSAMALLEATGLLRRAL